MRTPQLLGYVDSYLRRQLCETHREAFSLQELRDDGCQMLHGRLGKSLPVDIHQRMARRSAGICVGGRRMLASRLVCLGLLVAREDGRPDEVGFQLGWHVPCKSRVTALLA